MGGRATHSRSRRLRTWAGALMPKPTTIGS